MAFTLKRADQRLPRRSITLNLLFVDGGAAKDRSDSMGRLAHGLLPLAWALTLACDSLRLRAAGAGGQEHLAMSTNVPFNVIDSDGPIVTKEEC